MGEREKRYEYRIWIFLFRLFHVGSPPRFLASTRAGRFTLTPHTAISTGRFLGKFNYANDFNPSYQTDSLFL